MKKFIGPYVPHKFTIHGSEIKNIAIARHSLDNKFRFVIWQNSLGGWSCIGGFSKDIFETKEFAMEALDKKLLEEDFTLLTQEQWDKLSILI